MESDSDLWKPIRSGDKFENPFPNWKFPSFWSLIKWKLLEKDNSNIPKEKV